MNTVINVLSVKNPWAFAILNLGKNIENRSRKTTYRGRLYIHASAEPDLNAFQRICDIGNSLGRIYNDMTREEMYSNNGCILGYVDLIDCSRGISSSNPWAERDCAWWYFRDPVQLTKPVPAKGKLGIWKFDVPEKYQILFDKEPI